MRKALLWILVVVVSGFLFAFPITLVDDLGRVVNVSQRPQRIVVAAPAITDYLVRLGVSDEIVGVTDFDTFQGENVEKIGKMVPLNLEKILSLQPDIVFLTGGFQEPEVSKLESAGIKCLVINPQSLNDVLKDTVLIGSAVGELGKARELVKGYRSRFLEIAKQAYAIPQSKKLKVFYGMPNQNFSQIWTCGSGSYMNEVIVYAGGVNVAAGYTGNNGWFPVGPEFVVKEDPDVIIVPYWYEGGKENAIKAVLDYKPWGGVSAVKNKRVYAVDGNLASNPNLNLFKLVEELYGLLYGKK